MKKIVSALAAGLMLLGTASTANALGVGVKAGTLGFGAELGFQTTDHIVTRVAMNKYKFGANQTSNNIDYTLDLDLSSTAILFDFSLFSEGSLHLTLGYINNNSKFGGSATTSTVNNVNYGTPITLNTTVELGSGPYVGIGWGNVPYPGIGLTFELGVLQMGAPKAHITASGAVQPSAQDVAQEEQNLQNELNNFELYPVVSAGISIGF